VLSSINKTFNLYLNSRKYKHLDLEIVCQKAELNFDVRRLRSWTIKFYLIVRATLPIVLFSAFAFLSCEKDVPVSVRLPNAATSLNKITFTLDTSYYIFYSLPSCYYFPGSNFAVLTAFDSLGDAFDLHTYNINPYNSPIGPYTTNDTASLITFSDNASGRFFQGSGNVTFFGMSAGNPSGFVSGTFQATVRDKAGNSYQIADGQFQYIPLPTQSASGEVIDWEELFD